MRIVRDVGGRRENGGRVWGRSWGESVRGLLKSLFDGGVGSGGDERHRGTQNYVRRP